MPCHPASPARPYLTADHQSDKKEEGRAETDPRPTGPRTRTTPDREGGFWPGVVNDYDGDYDTAGDNATGNAPGTSEPEANMSQIVQDPCPTCGHREPLPLRGDVVYRCVAPDGELLYVGVTGQPRQRLKKHRNGSPWWRDDLTIHLTGFPDRGAAERAEFEAILTEDPTYNISIGLGPDGTIRR